MTEYQGVLYKCINCGVFTRGKYCEDCSTAAKRQKVAEDQKQIEEDRTINRCGNAHNNAEESCLECEIIKKNL